MIQGIQISRKVSIERPDLTGRPGGPARSIGQQKPYRGTTIKVPVEPEPDAAEMAVNITKAAAAWIAKGMPVVTQAEYDARGAICEPCEYWDGKARLGLGKCKAPGCGCTKFKRWLATEICKHPQGPKWPVISRNYSAEHPSA